MWMCIFLLFTVFSACKGCTLKDMGKTLDITARTGESVLLPCYCTQLRFTPETFTWKKDRNTWEVIDSESDQYRDRVQLFNAQSPGNLSLLISHLTEEDGGYYWCDVKDVGRTYIRLTIKGCTLDRSEKNDITAHTGESVLLPCYCTDLLTSPEKVTWKKYNTDRNEWDVIRSESDQQRVQLVNSHSPGNLSLLISQLTKKNEGWYKCQIKENEQQDVKLNVDGTPTILTTSAPSVSGRTRTITGTTELSTVMAFQNESSDPSGPLSVETFLFIFAALGGLLLLMLLGGLIYWRYKAQSRGRFGCCDGKREKKRDQETQEDSAQLYCSISSEPTDKAEQKQNNPEMLYATVNLQNKHKNTKEKDDVTYSAIDHSKAPRPAHTQLDTGDPTEYASIKIH